MVTPTVMGMLLPMATVTDMLLMGNLMDMLQMDTVMEMFPTDMLPASVTMTMDSRTGPAQPK